MREKEVPPILPCFTLLCEGRERMKCFCVCERKSVRDQLILSFFLKMQTLQTFHIKRSIRIRFKKGWIRIRNFFPLKVGSGSGYLDYIQRSFIFLVSIQVSNKAINNTSGRGIILLRQIIQPFVHRKQITLTLTTSISGLRNEIVYTEENLVAKVYKRNCKKNRIILLPDSIWFKSIKRERLEQAMFV